MEQLVFKTEIYEGPLDLLLDIIAKNKMSIFDIKISLIFEQYMAYLREMQEMNMEIAGEFITEASRLMLIKSRLLLPKPEEEDPRKELAVRLMEYKLVKNAAAWLHEREEEFGGRFQKDTDEIKPDKRILIEMDSAVLEAAMKKVLARIAEYEQAEREKPNVIAPLIKRKQISVAGRVMHILRVMARRKTAHIDEIFDEVTSRSELAATFYGLLELIKVGRIVPERTADDETGENVILRLNTERISGEEKEEQA